MSSFGRKMSEKQRKNGLAGNPLITGFPGTHSTARIDEALESMLDISQEVQRSVDERYSSGLIAQAVW